MRKDLIQTQKKIQNYIQTGYSITIIKLFFNKKILKKGNIRKYEKVINSNSYLGIYGILFNKENGNTKNANNTANQTTAYVKPQNPQGPTVALNLTDFKIDNDFILYQGAPFTGKITFDTFL